MAVIRPPKTKSEISKLTLAKVRNAYNDLADTYKKMMNVEWPYCHKCNRFISSSYFYRDTRYESGYFPICKDCMRDMAEGRYYDKDLKPDESKENIIAACRFMDIPFLYNVYDAAVKSAYADESGKASVFQKMVTMIKSLPQYSSMSFKDSEFGANGETEDLIDVTKIKRSTRKRFGSIYGDKDLLFLQNEYDDWTTRYECNTKAQEELFERLACKKLEIYKAQKEKQPTKDLDESYQRLMERANVTPRQNSMDVMSEGQTLGKLIEKWETERPLPDIDPELKDVDKIGRYVDVFFKGHLAKMLNLKNPLQHIYENYIKKYTVEKPEYDEDSDSDELFTKIFGQDDE